MQEIPDVHPVPWVSEVMCHSLPAPHLPSTVGPCELISRALDTCLIDTWNPKDCFHQQEEVCLHTLSCRAVILLSVFLPLSLQALGPWGVRSFSTEMSGVILAFMVVNIFEVDECQGHTPGDTFSQWGSTNCEIWWFSLIFYIAAWKKDAQASLCCFLSQWVWYAGIGHK